MAEPRTKFTEEKREEYLALLRKGNLKMESARLIGLDYRTVRKRVLNDPEFKANMDLAMRQANEGIEKVLYEMAIEGDIKAISMWLKAHERSTYMERSQVDIHATPEALEMSQTQALTAITDLQTKLLERQRELADDDGLPLLEAEVLEESFTDDPVSPSVKQDE